MRYAHNPSQTVSRYPDYPLMFKFMVQQRGDGPHLHGMTGWEGGPSAPKISRIFFIRTITPKYLFCNACHYQRVNQRFGAENTNLSCFRIVPPCSIDVRT